MNPVEFSLPELWQTRSCEYAARRVETYEAQPQRRALSCFDIEKNTEAQASAKMAECAFSLWSGLDPGHHVAWGDTPDGGSDVEWPGLRWDVKGTAMHGRYLIWPLPKNFLYAEKQFDRLVLVKHAIPLFKISGWLTKAEFFEKKDIAGTDSRLFPGTWHVHQKVLHSMDKA